MKPPIRVKQVPGFPGYFAGTDASVWSKLTQVGRHWKKGQKTLRNIGPGWKRLKAVPYRKGSDRLVVRLYRDGVGYLRKLHHVILETFAGPCPPEMQARHLDDDPSNNNLDNLAWGTPKQNAADRDRNGKTARGERNGYSKLTEQQVRKIRKLILLGQTCRSIAIRFGVSLSKISSIGTGRSWAWLKRVW